MTSWAQAIAATLSLSLCALSCERDKPVLYPQQPQQPQYGQAPHPPGPQQPGPRPPQQPYPQQPAPQPQPQPQQPPSPQPQQPAPQAPVANDPINQVNIPFLRDRASSIVRELVASLEPRYKQRVTGIPLVVDPSINEVNAFAGCSKGKSFMAVTDGMLDIMAHLAQTQATDEVFGTHLVSDYIKYIAPRQKPGQPVVRPPPGFFNPTQHTDPRKVSRQHQVLDEQLAFVLGHELAHHYLGHLPCTASGGALTAAEISHVLSSAIPGFNQPNEWAADVAGTYNVLDTGKGRQNASLTEGGALLTMQFFSGFDQFSPADLIFGFERSHPPPQLRVPVIKGAANAWRNGLRMSL